jgi:peptidoglycan/LPS O-acetylase OafA/YrhL
MPKPIPAINPEIAPLRTISPLSRQASAHLNFLRGIAAFVVLLGHWRNLFFLDWPEVQNRHFWLAPLYFATKFGHEAVVVFFVLSGFLIGRTVLRPLWSGRWSVKHYAAHRLIRLELVLVPALALCWIWDSTGLHLFTTSPFYLGTSGSSVLLYRISDWISLRTFFGNIAFLQTIRVTPFGSDAPLWSLANEFWYYVLFPCLAILLTRRFSWPKRIIAAIFMLIVAGFVGKFIFGGFFIWLLGVLLIFLPAPHRLKPFQYWLLFCGALMLVLFQLVITTKFRAWERPLSTDYPLGVFVAVFMYVLLHFPKAVSTQYERFSSTIAGFSYTLYLTHLPVLVFCAAWIGHRSQPTSRNMLLPVAILCVVVLYSYGVAVLFEHNTDRIRKWLEPLLGA